MRREVDERFAAYVRARGDHLLRVALLLTGDWHAAEDLVQASLVKLYRAWPRLDTSADPDAYLRRIMVNTHRSWWRARWRREAPAAELGMLSIFPGFLGSVDPQDLLALLQSATDVREVGPASGPGWTGSAYSFTVATKLNGPVHTPVSLRGTVDVDQQGRVRQLDGQASFATTVSQIKITFGDFGLPVSVSPPPASQTWVPPRS
jgi:hypothetical protein